MHNAGAYVHNAAADVHNAGADVNKEIQFTNTKSCPIDIKSIQDETMKDQDLNKLKDVI